MWVPSTFMTGIEGEEDTEAKDEKSRDMWYEAPKSKTHSECNILEELWDNWPKKKRNGHRFWL